jgi:hypothetical protein
MVHTSNITGKLTATLNIHEIKLFYHFVTKLHFIRIAKVRKFVRHLIYRVITKEMTEIKHVLLSHGVT